MSADRAQRVKTLDETVESVIDQPVHSPRNVAVSWVNVIQNFVETKLRQVLPIVRCSSYLKNSHTRSAVLREH